MAEEAPLDDVGRAALRAEFAKVYGVHKLRSSVQADWYEHDLSRTGRGSLA